MITLYDYPRSSAATRVRLALALKGLSYESIEVHLLNEGGQQRHSHYLAKNPQGLVPTLVHDGCVITQSLAIIEYLDECYPTPPLLPYDREARAYVRSLALAIACDLHPLNNLKVLQYLKTKGFSDSETKAWAHHWLNETLDAIEKQLKTSIYRGRYCYRDEVGLADICLVAQLRRARALHFDLLPYPTLLSIEKNCLDLPAFKE